MTEQVKHTVEAVYIKMGEEPVKETFEHSLEAVQERIGGYIDAVRLPYGITMWVDDEGLIKELPFNIVTIRQNEVLHQIAGNVLFTGIDDEGETISLNNDQMSWLQDKIKIAGETRNKDGFRYRVYGIAVD